MVNDDLSHFLVLYKMVWFKTNAA